MNSIFPSAFMLNTFSMTALLIVAGLTDNSSLAAEIGIVQGAMLALFYAFSANARSLILGRSTVPAAVILVTRLLLLLPLAIVSYYLSASVVDIEQWMIIALIMRRCSEWLSEVHLSEMERLGNRVYARQFFIVQALLLAAVLYSVIANLPFLMPALFLWAAIPLLPSIGFIGKSLVSLPKLSVQLASKMLPHFGSTAIIGVTVYVFRTLILLLAGKAVAGDLFTAFAIGGLTGSVFANVLGASIALHEQRTGKPYFPWLLQYLLVLSFVLGVLLFLLAYFEFQLLARTAKSYLFWQATGLSLIGGVVMVYAQRIRFRLLQHDDEHDVFGPDLLINILILALTAGIYFVWGTDAMAGLYLVSSLLALLFYISAGRGRASTVHRISKPSKSWHFLLAAMLLIPVFFQMNEGIFDSSAVNYASGGILGQLPLPVSLLACAGGLLLIGIYHRAVVSFGFIFSIAMLMMVSTIIVTQAYPAEQQAKLLLLVQFLLPMMALVLGQIFIGAGNRDRTICYSKAFLFVLLVIVPWQLIASLLFGRGFLVSYLYVFSIYQYLQYVPVIFVSAYLLTLFGLWHIPRYRAILFLTGLLMAIYVAASISMLAIGLYLLGVLLFSVYCLIKNSSKTPCIMLLLALILIAGYMHSEKDAIQFKFKFLQNDTVSVLSTGQEADEVAPNVTQRLAYWKFYGAKAIENTQAFLLGHAGQPDRKKYPSAHNYYLDFVYNFGLIALLPMLFLLAYTMILIYRSRRLIFMTPDLAGLCFVVLFLLIVDNMFKVGMRQPYPGIFTFFLWGILLSRLQGISVPKRKGDADPAFSRRDIPVSWRDQHCGF